jgi:hypothetical protein
MGMVGGNKWGMVGGSKGRVPRGVADGDSEILTTVTDVTHIAGRGEGLGEGA